MEQLKQYLPYIIGGIVLLFVLSRLRGGTSTKLVPQTQFVETPQTDPLATLRGDAFSALTSLAGVFIESESAKEIARQARESQQFIASKALDVEITKEQLQQRSILQGINLSLLQRENDRQAQQFAIDRTISNQRQSDIIGSVNQALSSIFGTRNGGSIFRTPPTFPGFF
jgi:DNA helicase IV